MKFSKYNVFVDLNKENYLLVNTFTGSIFNVDKETKTKITKNQINKFNQDEINDYLIHGIIIEDNIDELKFLSYVYNKSKFTSKVLSLTLLLTMDCNFRCTYCFQGINKENASSLNELNRDKIYKFITNSFTENRNLEILSLMLFGGEPLL